MTTDDRLRLSIFTALPGTPIPTDLTTPLDPAYQPAGEGRVDTEYADPDHTIGGPALTAVNAPPMLVIDWVDGPYGWDESRDHIVVGAGQDNSGRPVRMVAYRAYDAHHFQHNGCMRTTARLAVNADGWCASRYYSTEAAT